MNLVLPYPPTANLYWRVFHGRAVKSPEARQYQVRVKTMCLASRVRPLAGPLCVSFGVFRPRRLGDLDNALKVILDALRGIAFEDDSQVVEIHARRYDDKANPRVTVRIEPEREEANHESNLNPSENPELTD